MTTITIKRALLERALNALSAPNHCVFSEPPICVDLRAALAAPATSPEKCGHCGRRTIDPPWPVRTAPTTDDRHTQELLAQDITIANMRERHAQELCAYELTVDKLKSRRKPMDREEMMDGYCRTPQFNQFVQAFEAGVLYAEYFHGIGEKP